MAEINGIRMGETATVEPASARLRDGYGGAITLELATGGRAVQISLESEGARLLAQAIVAAMSTSEVAYRERNGPTSTKEET